MPLQRPMTDNAPAHATIKQANRETALEGSLPSSNSHFVAPANPPPPWILQRSLKMPHRATPDQVIQLQRLYGNQAVQKLVQPLRNPSRSMVVTRPDHASEQEAEHIADQLSASTFSSQLSGSITSSITHSEAPLLRQSASPTGPIEASSEVPSEVADGIDRARSTGTPLPPDVQNGMEMAFGESFGHVRIHSDVEADKLSGALNARAFTTGNDIFFKHGYFHPASQEGQHLLAHELTHVVQQAGTATIGRTIQRYVLVKEDALDSAWSFDKAHTFAGQVRNDAKERFRGSAETGKDEEVTVRDETPEQIQQFYADNNLASGFALKISNNGNAAVEKSTDLREAKCMYASPDLVSGSNKKLEGVGSAIRLIESSEELKLSHNDNPITLKRYYPKNLVTAKKGTTMAESDTEETSGLSMLGRRECILFAKQLMGLDIGGSKRYVPHMAPMDDLNFTSDITLRKIQDTILRDQVKGVILQSRGLEGMSAMSIFRGANGPNIRSQLSTDDNGMLNTLLELVDCHNNDSDPSQDLEDLLEQVFSMKDDLELLQDGRIISLGIGLAQMTLDGGHTLDDSWFRDSMIKGWFEMATQFYVYRFLKRGGQNEKISPFGDLTFASGLGINEYANANVGCAFRNWNLTQHESQMENNNVVMDSNKTEWNYHWAGIVAKDGDDVVTLENFADGRENALRDPAWKFDMYGTQIGQTFHEEQSAILPDSTTLTTVRERITNVDYEEPADIARQPQEPVKTREEMLRELPLVERFRSVRQTLVSRSKRSTGMFRKLNAYNRLLSKLTECAAIASRDSLTTEDYQNLVKLITESLGLAKNGARSQHGQFAKKGRRDGALDQLVNDLECILQNLPTQDLPPTNTEKLRAWWDANRPHFGTS